MRDYLSLHLDFVLSKVNTIIILFLIIIMMLSSLYNSQIFEGYSYLDAFRSEFTYDFLNESFIVNEFIMVFISIYLGMVLAGKNNQSLMVYSVTLPKEKLLYVSSRIILGIMIIFLIFFTISTFILSITYLFTPFIINLEKFFNLSLLMFLEFIQYFLMSLIFIGIIGHYLVGIVPMLIFWLLEIFSYDLSDRIKKIMASIIVNNNGYQTQENNLIILISVFLFFTISYIIYMKIKDC